MLFASLRHFVKMPLKPTLALQLVISNLHLLLLHLLNLLVLIIFALLPNVLVFILSVSLHRYCDPDVVMLKHVDDNMKQAGAKPYTLQAQNLLQELILYNEGDSKPIAQSLLRMLCYTTVSMNVFKRASASSP
jgi:hypothetical protein